MNTIEVGDTVYAQYVTQMTWREAEVIAKRSYGGLRLKLKGQRIYFDRPRDRLLTQEDWVARMLTV